MKRLHRFLELPLADKKLIVLSLALIVVVRVGLWILPFTILDRWLNAVTPVRDNRADWSSVRRIVRSVRSTSRFIPHATCLTQALVTRILLKMDGHPSDLKIGVEKSTGEKLVAHAWIEVNGRIVIGKVPHHNRFAVLS